MRYEQRVGRVYRYGQDKVVQIYNLRARDTVEETVRSYFEARLRVAAQALQQVTGEDPEELIASLNWQLETEIEPDEIYKRALVDGTLNKQTKEEIQEAVKRAQKAFEIATQSLFKDVSSYSFDSYQKALASPVNLKDLEDFTLKFLARERRQVQRKDGFYEFLTPEEMKENALDERYRRATFDRATAIRDSQADFLALGHPFIDAMLRRVGDYSFGGHTTVRVIPVNGLDLKRPWRATSLISWSARESNAKTGMNTFSTCTRWLCCLTEASTRHFPLWLPVAIARMTHPRRKSNKALDSLDKMDVEEAFQYAKAHVERTAQLWDWEDVELIGVGGADWRGASCNPSCKLKAVTSIMPA
jgi:hypothetical protein